MKIAVIGSGGWGTALANLLCRNGHDVTLWSFRQEEIDRIRETGENPLLAGVRVEPPIALTTDLSCASGVDLVVVATPSFAVRQTAEALKLHLSKEQKLVSVTKGIEAETNLRMSQILTQVTGCETAVLSGPSHAEEVGRGIPTGCVAAAENRAFAEFVQSVFFSDCFRVYTSGDVVGVELAAALKNVIALCAGISDGIGCGDNTKALLMTRGAAETARLCVTLGGKRETIAGLAGIGDLIVTCTSMHSRNRRAGILIGQGLSPQEAMEQVGAVVEGYYATRSAYDLSRKTGVSMPITEQAYAVLYEGKSPRDAMEALMTRAGRREEEPTAIK